MGDGDLGIGIVIKAMVQREQQKSTQSTKDSDYLLKDNKGPLINIAISLFYE